MLKWILELTMQNIKIWLEIEENPMFQISYRDHYLYLANKK